MTKGFVVGALVIGVGFIINVEFNGLEGTIIKDFGEEILYDKNKSPAGMGHTYCIHWKGRALDLEECTLRTNLKLVLPDGEKSVTELFAVLPNKYNFEHYDEIAKEMLEELAKQKELETME